MKPSMDYFISRVLGPLLNVFDYHGQNVRMLYECSMILKAAS